MRAVPGAAPGAPGRVRSPPVPSRPVALRTERRSPPRLWNKGFIFQPEGNVSFLAPSLVSEPAALGGPRKIFASAKSTKIVLRCVSPGHRDEASSRRAPLCPRRRTRGGRATTAAPPVGVEQKRLPNKPTAGSFVMLFKRGKGFYL